MIHYQNVYPVAVLTMDLAPVNAMGQAIRESMLALLERAVSDDEVKAVIITSDQPLFSGGADIEEFTTGDLWNAPNLVDLVDAFEQCPKLTIAAINGVAVGGGLELALGCDYRIAAPSARLGLPEIKLGLFPGAGGTQRLPRIAGFGLAMDMILSGKPVTAEKAHKYQLVDRVAESDHFREAAIAFANELIDRDAPLRPCTDIVPESGPEIERLFAQTRHDISQKPGDPTAARACIDSLERSLTLPLPEAMAADAKAFDALLDTAQARAQIHLFFAEREAQRVRGVTSHTPKRPVKSIAVIGAGTMGIGIVIACLDAGYPVTVLEQDQTALDQGLDRIHAHYDRAVQKGRLSPDAARQRQLSAKGALDYSALTDVDLVIEAVFEDMAVKRSVFEQLDKVCKPGAILASNTSTLDLDTIADFTQRPEDVIGLHFFSPANIMRLLEIVRGKETSDTVLKTAMDFGRRIRKLPVVVGVCFGFVGNRMLEPFFREGSRLLLEGASAEQVDAVLTNFGMAMGIMSVSDLAGIDVSYRIRQTRLHEIAHDPTYQAIQDKLFELGRYGQKTGRGSYFYIGREKKNDPEVVTLCEQLAEHHGVTRRRISDQEILERCLYPLINEGIQILDEGIASRPGDCDLIWVNGYGFPAWRGGPLKYAEEIGLETILAGMQRYRHQLGEYGKMWFQPAPMLERLVREGRGLKNPET